MTLYEELTKRGLIAQVTDENEISRMIKGKKQMKHIKMFIAPIISVALVLSAAPCVSAENVLTESAASGSYGIEAKRIEYIGEKADFSVDIPSDRFDAIELSEGEIRNNDDGSLECDLFYGESENGYISCAFHQSDEGFEGEAASWSGTENTVLYTGISADGQPYCIAEMNMYGFSAFIGEFPIGEDTWLNITLSFPESEMDAVRDDIKAMMNTFTGIDHSLGVNESGGNNDVNPDTGNAALPITVLVLFIITSAIVMVVNAVKLHKNISKNN